MFLVIIKHRHFAGTVVNLFTGQRVKFKQQKNLIDDLVKDTLGAMLAATRFKKIVSKTSKPVADAFRDILIEIISELTKKLIFGG